MLPIFYMDAVHIARVILYVAALVAFFILSLYRIIQAPLTVEHIYRRWMFPSMCVTDEYKN